MRPLDSACRQERMNTYPHSSANSTGSTQLLRGFDRWTGILDQGGSVDVICLDFSKAFGSVSHARLLLKLPNLGIPGAILKWIVDFLPDRS